MKNFCVILSRVSTMHQQVEQQTSELLNEAVRIGYDQDHCIVIENHESAIKLSEAERQGLRDLYRACDEKPVSCVICYEVSRLSRQPQMLYKIRDFLLERRIQLIILKPYLQMLDPNGQMSQAANIMFSLFSAMSESEMMIKRERMMRGKRTRMAAGQYVGGYLALGYRVERPSRHIVVDEEMSQLVRRMFIMCRQGCSTHVIARTLRSEGYFTTQLMDSTLALVDNTLRHRQYTGWYDGHGYQYPAIVSEELFMECQEIRRKHRKPKGKTKIPYFSAPMLRHRVDKRRLTASYGNQIYMCQNFSNGERISININIMDSLTWNIVSQYVTQKSSKEDIQHHISVLENKHSIASRIIHDNEEQYAKIQRSIDRCEMRIVMGQCNEQRGDAIIRQLVRKCEELQLANVEAMHQQTELMNEVCHLQQLEMLGITAAQEQLPTEDLERQQLCHSTISEILISKIDGQKRGWFSVEYCFTDGQRQEMIICATSRHWKVYTTTMQQVDIERLKRV